MASAGTHEGSTYDVEERRKEAKFGVHYKWIALSNTTIGALMATIDGSILLISLPAIFNGMGINPLVSNNIDLLLWLLLGYTIVSSVTVVTIGRLSDMFGRVRLYNMGFAIFATASTLLYISSYLITGTAGVISLTLLRLLQGLGGGFLFANSAAILTDAFPQNERGKALGFNSIAVVGGTLAGMLIGGVLAGIDWHLIFLISVPVGVIGTIWAYLALHEIATLNRKQKLDVYGNVTFAASLALLLLSLTYGILPYNGSPTGWADPYVQLGFATGVALMVAFVFIELRTENPMLHLKLFRIKAFAAGNMSLLLAGMARGGLQFMLIIWLQGVWLPLHGISFENTPFQAAIAMAPLVLGLLVAAPLFGYLSDKYGSRSFTTTGMLINVVGLVALASMPANFDYVLFAVTIFFIGIGQGMFTPPNTAFVMSSVPPEYRGIASGMRATILNVAFMFSLAIFFSLLILGVSSSLPAALYNGLVAQNVSVNTASQLSIDIPPSAALFAALLGYSPLKALIPQSTMNTIPIRNQEVILSTSFFPNLISEPFMEGMRIVMYAGAAMALLAAIFSAIKTRRPHENGGGLP